MAVDPRRRQKKLQRRQERQKAERRALARRESGGLPTRLRQASTAPFLHCCASADVWDEGIGQVLVSRLLPNGQVAFAAFLVDMYCLGVKDVFANIAPRTRYEQDLYDKSVRQSRQIKMQPECARKLVEGAVAYANDLGIPPHPDYRVARLIFGDVCAEACTHEYTYGKDGQPLFIAGPYDGPARCQEVIHILHRRCGPQGFHFLAPIHTPLPR